MTSIGLVGCGGWGRHILRDLRSLDCDVHVVARSEASRQRAVDGGASTIVSEVGRLPAIDGAVIATPTSLHTASIDEVLPLGVPIYCEKALSDDLVEAERVVAAAGERLFVMDKWRYHPGIEELSRLAAEGALGRVLGVRTIRHGWGNPHPDVDAVWILAPHDLSIALEVLGSLPTLRAAVADVVGGVAVGITALLAEDGGPWLHLDVSARTSQHRRSTYVVGDAAVAELSDGYASEVVIQPASDPWETTPPPAKRLPISAEMPLLRELRAFVEHLEGGPPPRSSAADAIAVVRALTELRALAGLPPQGRYVGP